MYSIQDAPFRLLSLSTMEFTTKNAAGAFSFHIKVIRKTDDRDLPTPPMSDEKCAI